MCVGGQLLKAACALEVSRLESRAIKSPTRNSFSLEMAVFFPPRVSGLGLSKPRLENPEDSGLTPYQFLILDTSAGGSEIPQGQKEAEQLIGTNGEQLLPGIKKSK